MKQKHMIDFNDMPLSDFMSLAALADDIIKNRQRYSDTCRGRVLATLFYEPSTRTQFSFQTAMLRLGGTVIGFSDPGSSSVSKGESLKDTVKIVSGYTDIAVIRSPLEGAALAASLYSGVPLINAGDGGHLHPTQTLTDLFTILRFKNTLSGLKIGVCGDLLNGRTVHSLLRAFTRLSGNTFYLISTKELCLPQYVIDEFSGTGNTLIFVNSIEECISELDLLYMTRIQKERFSSDEEYRKQAGVYILDKNKMLLAKESLHVLHPLPKVDEISDEVDLDPRCIYFEQAKCGMYIRMALIVSMLENAESAKEISFSRSNEKCKNPRCVVNHEKYLPSLEKKSDGTSWTCAYCEHTSKSYS